MGETGSNKQFSYSGYLKFSILSTEFSSELGDDLEKIRDSLLDSLPEFGSGTPNHPSRGYERLQIEELNNIDPYSHNEFIGLRHKRETFTPSEAYVDGELREVPFRSVDSTDLIWHYPDLLFCRGSESQVDQTIKYLNSSLVDKLRLSQVQFDSDFFLYLVWKVISGESTNDLIIKRLTDAELIGSQDLFGQSSSVGDSTDITNSIQFIQSVLQGKSIQALEGNFSVGGNLIQARIDRDRVHLKTSRGTIQDINDASRFGISLSFLTTLAQTYQTWTELDDSERYPPEEFFEHLVTVAENQGVFVDSMSDVVSEYAEKRGSESSRSF